MNAIIRFPRLILPALLLGALSVIAVNGVSAAETRTTAPANPRYTLDIPAQNLESALQAVAIAVNGKVLYRRELLAGRKSTGLQGEFTTEQAIKQLLSGTDLVYEFTSSSVVLIRPKGEPLSTGSQKGAANLTQDWITLAGDEPHPGVALPAGKARAEGVEEMLVEGEREKPVPFSTANLDLTRSESDVLPFQTFTAREIELSGSTNIEEFFRKRLPQFVSDYLPEEVNTAGKDPLTGSTATSQNQLNLRGWGARQGDAARETLILVNGRPLPPRFVSSGTDGQMIPGDYRSIPIGLIERIEILTSAGSAIYGGNATSGVINIILRRDVRGGTVSVNYSNPWEGRAPKRVLSASYGLPLKWGIGLQLSGGMNDSESLRVKDRLEALGINALARRGNERRWIDTGLFETPEEYIEDGRNPYNIINAPPTGATTNIQSTSLRAGNLFASVSTPPGASTNITSVPDGYTGGQGLQPFLSRIGVYNYALSDGGNDRSYSKNATIGDPNRSKNLSVSLDKALGERLRLSFGYSYMQSESDPTAIYSGIQNYLVVPGSAAINPFGQDVRVGFDDPRLQQPEVTKHFLSVSQGFSATLHATLGKWQGVFDASYSRDRTEWRNNYFYAPSGGWRNAFMTGTYNPFVDMRAVAPASADLYRNFTLNVSVGDSQSTSSQAALRFSGPVFRLPGGMAQLTTGLTGSMQERGSGQQGTAFINSVTGERVPYIDGDPERFSSQLDGGQVLEISQNRKYRFAQYGIYAETTLPVLSSDNQVPLARNLELYASGRMDYGPRKGSKYIGNDSEGNNLYEPFTSDVRPHTEAFGLRHDIVEGLSMRVSRSIGFRPPTIDQTIAYPTPPAATLQNLRDPKRGNLIFNLVASQFFQGGNPDLTPETSVSTNFGVLLQPRFVPGLRISVDYLQNVRNDAITPVDAQFVITHEDDMPGRVQRGPAIGGGAGPITFVDARTANFLMMSQRSLDLGVSQQFDGIFAGQLTLSAAASRLMSFKIQFNKDQPPQEQIRREIEVNNNGQAFVSQTVPWNANAQLQWQRQRWSIGWSARYLDRLVSYYYDEEGLFRRNVIAYAFDHDAFVNYRAPDVERPRGSQWLYANMSITFGVQNVLNRLQRRDEYGAPVGIDSIVGRAFSVQASKSF